MYGGRARGDYRVAGQDAITADGSLVRRQASRAQAGLACANGNRRSFQASRVQADQVRGVGAAAAVRLLSAAVGHRAFVRTWSSIGRVRQFGGEVCRARDRLRRTRACGSAASRAFRRLGHVSEFILAATTADFVASGRRSGPASRALRSLDRGGCEESPAVEGVRGCVDNRSRADAAMRRGPRAAGSGRPARDSRRSGRRLPAQCGDAGRDRGRSNVALAPVAGGRSGRAGDAPTTAAGSRGRGRRSGGYRPEDGEPSSPLASCTTHRARTAAHGRWVCRSRGRPRAGGAHAEQVFAAPAWAGGRTRRRRCARATFACFARLGHQATTSGRHSRAARARTARPSRRS